MKSGILIVLLASAALTYAELSCIEGNCTEPKLTPLMPIDMLSEFLPIHKTPSEGKIDTLNVEENIFANKEENRFDDAIDPRLPFDKVNDDQPHGILIFRIRQIAMMPKEDQSEETAVNNVLPPFFPMFDELTNIFKELGHLDLPGVNLTGGELTELLSLHPVPITGLTLSGSRIHNFTADTFKPVEKSLQYLKMDNCTVSFEALGQLTNLRTLNLSNNELSTFEWFPQLSTTLEVLDLSHNHFREVRPELTTLLSLKELDLSYNRITSLGKYPITAFPTLEKLYLTMNSITQANLEGLYSLQEVRLDWNYLRLLGQDLVLPPQPLTLRLASNPWRCDCGLLEARDINNVADLNLLQCANRLSYFECDDCNRVFLPNENGLQVANLTVDSIEHLGCTGISDLFYLMRKGLTEVKEREPEKLVQLCLVLTSLLLIVAALLVILRRQCAQKKFDNRAWLKIQEIPYLIINNQGKPKDVPYEKMDTPIIKT